MVSLIDREIGQNPEGGADLLLAPDLSEAPECLLVETSRSFDLASRSGEVTEIGVAPSDSSRICETARELEGLERDRFQLGDSTQFLVNLRELNTADAAFREVKALADYQKALVDFEAASGRLVDRLPPP